MPESIPPSLRTDALTGHSVIVAPDRGSRPGATQRGPQLQHPEDGDPFLEGCESATPGEVLALRESDSAPNTPGWLIRVVPNRFPTLAPAAQPPARSHDLLPQSIVFGAHDVVIESPDDRQQLMQTTPPEFARVLFAWRRRIEQLERNPDIAAVSAFRNEGFRAGASLPHVHSQIVGMNAVPHEIAGRLQRAIDYRQRTGRDLFDDLCAAELHEERRIIDASSDLLIYCPFAGRVAWQVRFVARSASQQQYSAASSRLLGRLAAAIHSTVDAITQIIGEFAFNLVLIQSPVGRREMPWYIDLIPRTAGSAGFEFTTDVDIVTTAPEFAAEQLRNAIHWTSAESSLIEPAGYEWITA